MIRNVQQYSRRAQQGLATEKNLTPVMVKWICSTRATGTNLAMKAVMLSTQSQLSTKIQ